VKITTFLFAHLLLLYAVNGYTHPGSSTRIAHLDEQIAIHPAEQTLYIKRGAEFAHLGQWTQAIRDFDLAETLGVPEEVALQRGLLHYSRGEYSEARAALDRYLSLHPAHAQALLSRARASNAAGDRHSAIKDYQVYLAQARSPHPGDLLAAARLLASSPDPAESGALALLDQGIITLGPVPQLQRYAVQLELRRNNLQGAMDRWQTMEAVLGQNPQWKIEMAELLFLAQREQDAMLLLVQASEQLSELRQTPARHKLQEKIRRLTNATGSSHRQSSASNQDGQFPPW